MLKKYYLTTEYSKDNIPIAKAKEGIIYLTTKKTDITHIKDLTDNFIIPIIEPRMNVRTYAAGNSGCGKSYVISLYIKMYKRIYKNSPIFLFSVVDYDKTFEIENVEKYITRVDLKDIENFDIADFDNSLVIFDDFTMLDKREQAAVQAFKGSILKRGRHAGIDSFTTNDKLLGGALTVKDILQSIYVFLFPMTGGNENEIINYLKNKLNFTQAEIDAIINNETSRWICIHRTYPKFVVTADEVYLIRKNK